MIENQFIKNMRISQNAKIAEHWDETLTQEEIESIESGLEDLEEGRIHSHETARKIYEKYL
jgi:predicted transcriptional regulator